MAIEMKYPRTPHRLCSLGATSDDVFINCEGSFLGEEVVVTEKMDGENTSMYREGIHARSLDSVDHPSRHWVKALHSSIARDIPENMRICGENLYAEHSIHYDDLESYFLTFSIWEGNIILSWDDTVEWAGLLGLSMVPVLYRGIWDGYLPRDCKLDLEKQEGYVVRVASSFKVWDFGTNVAKFVRSGHVQTDSHWMEKPIVKNGLHQG